MNQAEILTERLLQESDYQDAPQKRYTEIVGQIFTAYKPRILRMAQFGELSPDDAEDLCQDVGLLIFLHLRGFRGDSRFASWLFKIVHNAISDKKRRLGARSCVLALGDLAHSSDGEDELLVEPSSDLKDPWRKLIISDLLKQLLASLEPRRRTLFLLKYAEGWEVEEISKALRMKPGTVKSQLNRTRAILLRRYRQLASEPGQRAR